MSLPNQLSASIAMIGVSRNQRLADKLKLGAQLMRTVVRTLARIQILKKVEE